MNYKKNKIRVLLALAGVFFLTAALLAGSKLTTTKQDILEKAAASTNLSIAPLTQNAIGDENISFTVMMDTGPNHVTGLDLVLKFDPTVMFITGMQAGTGIQNLDSPFNVNFDNTTGVITYSTFTVNKNQAVNGSSLETLIINAQVKQNPPAGSYLVSFDPSTAISATNETTNVLDTTNNGNLIIKASATPDPTITPSPEPNSCGGTCGSNINCQSAYVCYNGFCRNPSCSTSTDCICRAPTATPTTRPTTIAAKTTKPSIKPTTSSTIISPTDSPVIEYSDPEATDNNFWQRIYDNSQQLSTPTPIVEPEPAVNNLFSGSNILPWIIGSLIVAGLTMILIVIGIYKQIGSRKNKPPVIKI